MSGFNHIPELEGKDLFEELNNFQTLILIVEKYFFYFVQILPLLTDSNIEKLLVKFPSLNKTLYDYLKENDHDERIYQLLVKYLDVEIMNLSIKDTNFSLLETCFLNNVIPNKSTYKLLIEYDLFNNILEYGFIKFEEVDFTSIIIDFIQSDPRPYSHAYVFISKFFESKNLKNNYENILNEALSWARIDIVQFILDELNIDKKSIDLSKIDNSETLKYLTLETMV